MAGDLLMIPCSNPRKPQNPEIITGGAMLMGGVPSRFFNQQSLFCEIVQYVFY